MVSSKTFGASAIAVIGLLQMCPAPIEIVAAVVGGVVSGGIAGGISAGIANSKRAAFIGSILERDLPPGVSQESIDLCKNDINAQFNADGTAVNVYSTSDTSARVDNLPATCMTLVTVLTDEPAQAGGPVPIVLGTSSVEYQGMTSQELTDLQNTLSAA